MTIVADENNPLTCRRALEGLRNGVPNEAAVKILGCHQPQAESQFQALLSRAMKQDEPPSGALGMLVAGDFGTGKISPAFIPGTSSFIAGFLCAAN